MKQPICGNQQSKSRISNQLIIALSVCVRLKMGYHTSHFHFKRENDDQPSFGVAHLQTIHQSHITHPGLDFNRRSSRTVAARQNISK